MKSLIDRHLGGLIPSMRFEREVHVFDGQSLRAELVWLRIGLELVLHLPRWRWRP